MTERGELTSPFRRHENNDVAHRANTMPELSRNGERAEVMLKLSSSMRRTRWKEVVCSE